MHIFKSNKDTANTEERQMTRRDFLRRASMMTAAAAVPSVLGSCSSEDITETNRPIVTMHHSKGKMTYHLNPNTGNLVSILGYGSKHLPLLRNAVATPGVDNIDQEMVNRSVDYALDNGVNFFNAAPDYCNGLCERSMGKALSRHPRSSYLLSTKLANTEPDQQSFEASKAMYLNSFKDLQTDYLNVYMLHNIGIGGMENFNRRFIDNGILDYLKEERKKNRILNLGFSFTGDIEVFNHALKMHDEGIVKWDFGQVSINYVDWFCPSGGRYSDTDSQYLYDELNRRNIPVIAVDPLLGGQLGMVSRPLSQEMFRRQPDDAISSWAMRFVGTLTGVKTIIVGMLYIEHLKDNVYNCSPLKPLSADEIQFLKQCAERISRHPIVKCVGCMECMPCPYGVDIVGTFSHYNLCLNEDNVILDLDGPDPEYNKKRRAFLVGLNNSVDKLRQADHCIGCGECLQKCPRHINIPGRLHQISEYTQKLRTPELPRL